MSLSFALRLDHQRASVSEESHSQTILYSSLHPGVQTWIDLLRDEPQTDPLPESHWSSNLFFGLNCGACPVVSIAFGEESTNAHLNFKNEALARDGWAGAGGNSLLVDTWSGSTAARHGYGRERAAVFD